MSWPRDAFVSDGGYTTPLPRQPCEAALWRAVIRLYEYTSLATLLKVNESATVATGSGSSGTASAPPVTSTRPTSPATTAPPRAAGAAETASEAPLPIPDAAHTSGSGGGGARASTVASSGSFHSPSVTRAEVVERRSAFIAAADATSPVLSASPSFAFAGAPGLPQLRTTSRASSAVVTAAAAAATAGTPGASGHALPRVRSVGSWSDYSAAGGSFGSSSTTGYIRATCHRVLEPLEALLRQLHAERLRPCAGVMDVAVQHPLPALRLELVRLLLTYKLWDWAMCGAVAVAAGVGDTDVLALLLAVDDFEPNLGFPLTVAVRHPPSLAALDFLLAHPRIKPNYGGAFFVAVALGNLEAMYALGSAAGVNVNRFANNEGTSALLYALRQYLICTALETASPPAPLASSSPASRASSTSPHQPSGITPPASPLPPGTEEADVMVTPLLAGRSANGSKGHVKHDRLRFPSTDDPNGGVAAQTSKCIAATGAAAGVSGTRHGAAGPTTAVGGGGASLGKRDNPLFGGVSAADAADDAARAAAGGNAPALSSAVDEAHCAAFRHDSASHPLRTAHHWRAVLLYLLDHPAIEVNAGYYTTPLQMAVFTGNVELVGWLLQHPHLRPNRTPKSAAVLCNAYYLLQRQAFTPDALRCVVATPVEMAVQLNRLDAFRLLVQDRRVRLPVRLAMELEKVAWSESAVPYLTALAQHRVDWEGWGWRWRRRCIYLAALANSVIAVCCWVAWLFWPSDLAAFGTVMLCVYVVQVVMSCILLAWEVYTMSSRSSRRGAASTGTTVGDAAARAPTLLALVQHLAPGWSAVWQYGAAAGLLLCPGMVPLLDLLSARTLATIYGSRQPMQQADADATASSASPRDVDSANASLPTRERQERARRQSHSSFAAAHRWAGMSTGSSVSGNDSFANASHTASFFDNNDSFSRPRPAAARSRRQSSINPHATAGGGGSRGTAWRVHNVAAAAAAVHAAGTPAPLDGGGGGGGGGGGIAPSDSDALSRMASSVVSNSVAASPSVGPRREPWVLPGRPSRFALATEYHAPDLTLRALAYVTYDRLLVAPRLLLAVVGIFMFMYVLFPSSAPSETRSLSANSTDMATTTSLTFARAAPFVGRRRSTDSVFAVYYYPHSLREAAPQAADASAAAAPSVLASDATSTELPQYTVLMGVMGFCGLAASILSGGVLLAMATSLHVITAQSCFASPNERETGKDDRVVRRVAAREDGRRGAEPQTDFIM